MDINSLLSPQDSPLPETSSPAAPPVSTASNPTSRPSEPRTSKPAIRSAPRSLASKPPLPNVAAQARSPLSSPPTSNFPLRRPSRQGSTSGMDTLADLASMQQHHHQQAARANARGLRNADSFEARLSSANIRPSLQAIARTHSGSRSSLDINMTDAPTSTPPPRIFTTPSLSESDLQLLSQLVADLAVNGHAYDSHVQLVKVLHRGFLAHVFPNSSSIAENDPATYDLLGDLRQAIDAMASRFSLGEELWEIRLQLQQLIACSLEDCMGVVELCEKAVAEERGSSRLWATYGEWMLSLYTTGKPADRPAQQMSRPLGPSINLSEEDRIAMGEVFGRTQMLDVWKRGSEDTRYRMDTGHLIWNKYTDLLLQDLRNAPSTQAIDAFKAHFIERLKVAHEAWDETFQKFSNFISTYLSSHYEEIMVNTSRSTRTAKAQYAERMEFETQLQRVAETGDMLTEWTVFTNYLEANPPRTRKSNVKLMNFKLCNALYQRALLRFPSTASLWEDYLAFLGDEAVPDAERESYLSVLGRACNHCPWSGTLWAQYIQAAELANLQDPFTDIGEIKHKATSTGLLDFGGMEEVLKIHTSWCGFLRRKAFHKDSSDEERDVAEVGIRSAIEDTETLGRTKYGPSYKGDPKYRLDRIYIKFLVQSRNYKCARSTWDDLVKRHGSSYEFWMRYYSWEMVMWATLMNPEDAAAPRQTPTEATKVLSRAVQRFDLDWPEKIIDTYLSHCEDHEDAAALQTAVFQCRKATKAVGKRREQEAREAAELAKQHQAQAHTEAPAEIRSAKRKREEIRLDDDGAYKKTRSDLVTETPAMETPNEALKRDRENATVVVKNFPANITEKRVRHFFSDCGTINTIKLLPDQDGTSATATIEFDAKEDVLTAQTRDMKTFEGRAIAVQVGTGTTVYVTNFPPTADEIYIRNKLSKYGDIIDIRFPSLKFDTHRRFCYVQFKSADQSRAATELDGEAVEGNLKLVVKISDPSHKQNRQGAIHEGRELYVANLDWNATTEELNKIFSKYGEVEKVRIPRKLDGKSKGMAFVVFSTQEAATAALELNLAKFRSRLLNVTLATADPTKRSTATIFGRGSSSPQPGASNGAGSPSPAPSQPRPSFAEISSRTVVLLYVPDTVNDARIRAIAEPYGPLKKITLRPDHQGAVLEYSDVKGAGKAALGLEGYEISPGRRLQIGDIAELKKMKADWHKDKMEPVGKAKWNNKKDGEGKQISATSTTQLLPSAPVRRPGQQIGRRGGLGFRMNKGYAPSQGNENEQANGTGAPNGEGAASSATAPKSNADFQAMFTR